MNLLASLKGYLLSALGLLAAVVSIFAYGRKAGRDSLKAKQAAKTLKNVKKANEIRDKNAGADTGDVVRRLRKYQRK